MGLDSGKCTITSLKVEQTINLTTKINSQWQQQTAQEPSLTMMNGSIQLIRTTSTSYLCECMSLKHGHIDDIYPRTVQFSKDKLVELNPSDIRRYLLWKAYGDPYADDTKDEPRNA